MVLDFVDCNPLRSIFMWPFSVAMDESRCFLINSAVSPGHESKLPFFIALIKMLLIGEKQAGCKKEKQNIERLTQDSARCANFSLHVPLQQRGDKACCHASLATLPSGVV